MKKLFTIITMLFIFLYGFKVNAQTNNYEVHFIDTGQSDCILIKGKDKNYLIDTGLPRTYDKVLSYLNSQGISKLNKIIITHYHDDHYGGLEKLIQDKAVEKIVLPAHQPKYRDFLFSYLKAKPIEVEYASESTSIKDIGIDLKALIYNKEDRCIENNNSLVLLGTIDNIKYAFMADVEKEREKELLKNKELLGCDVVKVPHHALDTSSTIDLINILKPRIALVSCDGEESPNDKIVEKYLSNGAAVFRTDTHGNIVIKANVDTKEIEITCNKMIK